MSGFEWTIGPDGPPRSKALKRLEKVLQKGHLPHAILFTGIDGVGKRSAVAFLAMASNCLEVHAKPSTSNPVQEGQTPAAEPPPLQPCGHCTACRKIRSGQHPDVTELKPVGALLRISQIRELNRLLTLKPYEGRQRVILISRAQTMTPAAGNALLKVLEEPPERTTIVLTAPQASDLLPTILSRCQHFRLEPIPCVELSRHLSLVRGVEERTAGIVAALSGGSYTRALLMSQPAWIQRRRWLLVQLSLLAEMTVSSKLALAEKLAQEKKHLEDTLLIVESWLRDLMIFRYSPQHIINTDMQETIAALSKSIRTEKLEEQIKLFNELRGNLRFNPNMRLALEVLVCGLAKTVAYV